MVRVIEEGKEGEQEKIKQHRRVEEREIDRLKKKKKSGNDRRTEEGTSSKSF